MERNKGAFFWEQAVNKTEGHDLTDEEFAWCDSLEEKVKTEQDKEILAYFYVLIENNEQNERYFRQEFMTYVDEIYKGHSAKEALSKR